MPPAPRSVVYCTQSDIEAVLSIDGNIGRLDDATIGVIDSIGQAYLSRAISWASTKCDFYLANRYASQDLAGSWLVNQWCTIMACQWLSMRRGNPPPASIKDFYEEALDDLKMVQSGEVNLPDVGLRSNAWPAWSNVRVDPWYQLRKIRVERPLSENAPEILPGPARKFDHPADWTPEY